MKRKVITLKGICMTLVTALSLASVQAQQEIIMNKDNTRPETRRQMNMSDFASKQVSSFTVIKHNGYNEIHWNGFDQDGSNRFIVEYSYDGVNYLSSGSIASSNGTYNYKHYSSDTRPVLYRLRVDDATGKRYYSNTSYVDGIDVTPVELYSNVVRGNMLNATARFPVERVVITSAEGTPVMTKEISGARDFIPIAIPSLDRGIYLVSFYGNGWMTTKKFYVG